MYVDASLQMNPDEEIGVHRKTDADFKIIYYFATGVHLTTDTIFHFFRLLWGLRSVDWVMERWMNVFMCVKTSPFCSSMSN